MHLLKKERVGTSLKTKGVFQNLHNAMLLLLTAALKLTPKLSGLKQPFCFVHNFMGQELRKGSAGQIISAPHNIRWGSKSTRIHFQCGFITHILIPKGSLSLLFLPSLLLPPPPPSSSLPLLLSLSLFPPFPLTPSLSHRLSLPLSPSSLSLSLSFFLPLTVPALLLSLSPHPFPLSLPLPLSLHLSPLFLCLSFSASLSLSLSLSLSTYLPLRLPLACHILQSLSLWLGLLIAVWPRDSCTS